jgi:hypothetical protein
LASPCSCSPKHSSGPSVPSCLQELQQQNARLLVVNRQLSQEAEATRAQAEAALRAEYEAGLAGLSQQLEELRNSRKATEKVLQQVRRGAG